MERLSIMKKHKNEKKLNLRNKDPYFKREQQKYEQPLPSREWIIQLLKESAKPQKINSLAKKLSIKSSEYDFFERRLKAMARDNQIMINNKEGLICLINQLEVVKCQIEMHNGGFGFAIPLIKDEKGDFILHQKYMQNVMNGDIVNVCSIGIDKRGRRKGQIIEILERAYTDVVGRFYIKGNKPILKAEDKYLNQEIILEKESVKKFKPQSGQVILAKIERYPEDNCPAIAKIIEVLGDYADSGMEIEIAVRKHHLPYQFSSKCMHQTKKIPLKVRKSDLKDRIDLRNLPLVTIDGEDSRDFDDAVYAEKIGRNFRLIVAIADVSHYVHHNDDIDTDARERSTSVYFPRRVIPMLPEKLSNNICSLNPDVDRLCMVCDMKISYAGNIKEYQFYPAVMRSHARLTYNQVWEVLNRQQTNVYQKELNILYQLFQVLHKKRQQRGAIEFETTETKMIFNDNCKIEKIEPLIRNDAHKLIEECMLAANVCAADLLLKHKHTALFRNHVKPTPEKLSALRQQLALLGLQLNGADNPTPKDYAELSIQIQNRTDREIIQLMLLRSMQQAIYSDENLGHFGLAYQHYTHFTSPIRRYPDLLVHRAIKAILENKIYHVDSWKELAIHTSLCERRADEASRDVENWLKTYFMQNKIGQEFIGKISGLTHFGLFVTLDNIYIDGMIHIGDLGEDYFNFKPEIMAIKGERSGQIFRIGDTVHVKVVRADLNTGKIDLILLNKTTKKRIRNKKIKSNNVH